MLAIGDFLDIQVHSCMGGKSIGEDIRRLEHGVHAVSGTPGRVCNVIKRRTLRTRAIKLLILASLPAAYLYLFSIICSICTVLINNNSFHDI
jgi:hypothetical protein